MKFNTRGSLSLMALAVLTACGGGSGSSSPGLAPGAATQAPSPNEVQADSGTSDAHQKENQIFSVKVAYADDAELQSAMQLLDHANVDDQAGTISAEIDSLQMEQLRKLGLSVQIDQVETARIRQFVASISAGDDANKLEKISDGSGDHACYRTVEKIYAQFHALAAKYPNLVRVETVGKTFMGTQFDADDSTKSSFAKLMRKFLPTQMQRTFNFDLLPAEPLPIKAIVVGNFARQDAQAQKPPSLVMTGGIHAREYAPQEVGMKYIESLLDNYETDPNARMMVDSNRYHFIIHNPDGRKLAEQQAKESQRKNANYRDAACSDSKWSLSRHGGVDLNRNYPFGWGGPGAADSACNATYRGPSAASEPETQAVLNYARGTWNEAICKWEGGALSDGRPKSSEYCNAENRTSNGTGELDWLTSADENYEGGVYLDLHSSGRKLLWSWGVTRTENNMNLHTPNENGLASIAHRMAYHNGHSAQHVLDYATGGTTKDAVYGYLGAPAYTVEMGNSFYESCKQFSNTVLPENQKGINYVSRILRRPYQFALGPDTTSVTIAAAAIPAGERIEVTATVRDDSYLYSTPQNSGVKIAKPSIKNIKSATAYIDKLPWEAGAVGIPLKLSKQASPNQTVQGTLDTSSLAPGRHMVYVQGVNDGNKPGSVSAAFLNIR